MNQNQPPSLINLWTIAGALLVAGCLLLITLVSIGWTRPRHLGDLCRVSRRIAGGSLGGDAFARGWPDLLLGRMVQPQFVRGPSLVVDLLVSALAIVGGASLAAGIVFRAIEIVSPPPSPSAGEPDDEG